jgi:hypothetical protein
MIDHSGEYSPIPNPELAFQVDRLAADFEAEVANWCHRTGAEIFGCLVPRGSEQLAPPRSPSNPAW